MEFSASSIAASLIFSLIGLQVFRRGKATTNFYLIFIAIALMTYTYVTSNPFADWGVGFGLCALAKYYWDAQP